MPIISTDMRYLRESARRIRYEPTLPFTATNVQDAITQGNTFPKVIIGRVVNVGMSPYTPFTDDAVLLVDTSGGPITINLPPAINRNFLPLTIKDDTGNAAANPITIMPTGETIDGLSPYLLDANFAGVRVVPQNGGYFVDA